MNLFLLLFICVFTSYCYATTPTRNYFWCEYEFCPPLMKGQCNGMGSYEDECGCYKCYVGYGERCDHYDRLCGGLLICEGEQFSKPLFGRCALDPWVRNGTIRMKRDNTIKEIEKKRLQMKRSAMKYVFRKLARNNRYHQR